MTILQSQLTSMSREDMIALVLKMNAAKDRKLSLKVSEKGALCVYGLGRFPVTLYRGQWERLLEFIATGAIAEFITDNSASLSVKADKVEA
jgi:hypothetical protein